jgi:hypothetical protein
MRNNTCRATFGTMFEPQTDLSTDYALIAAGVVASLIALLYLVLI